MHPPLCAAGCTASELRCLPSMGRRTARWAPPAVGCRLLAAGLVCFLRGACCSCPDCATHCCATPHFALLLRCCACCCCSVRCRVLQPCGIDCPFHAGHLLRLQGPLLPPAAGSCDSRLHASAARGPAAGATQAGNTAQPAGRWGGEQRVGEEWAASCREGQAMLAAACEVLQQVKAARQVQQQAECSSVLRPAICR